MALPPDLVGQVLTWVLSRIDLVHALLAAFLALSLWINRLLFIRWDAERKGRLADAVTYAASMASSAKTNATIETFLSELVVTRRVEALLPDAPK